MSPELRPRIFEPFFTTRPDGHGLGLAAVAGIVRSHGAFLELESEVGEGTCFRLAFPVVPGEVVREDEVAEPARAELEGHRVLVVDDEGLVRSLVTSVFREARARVVEARDGLEALERFLDDPALTLVVTDLSMPGLRGDELLREMRERRPGLPVIVMTGFGCDRTPSADGRTALLSKPFRPNELLRKATELLGQQPPAQVPR